MIKNNVKHNILLITDPNTDPDDLSAFVILSGLMREGKVNLCGVVTCKGDKDIREKRAKFTSGAFNLLGFPNVPVCCGGDYPKRDLHNDDTFCRYSLVKTLVSASGKIEDNPRKFISEILEQNDDVTLVVIGPMNDAADFVRYKPELFKDKVKKIVVMGNVKDESCRPCPMSYNNAVCYSAAETLYKFAVDNRVKMILVPRDTVYTVQIDKTFYDVLQSRNNVIANVLAASNKMLVSVLWEDIQRGLYSHFDVRRFAKVFIGENFTIRSRIISAHDDFENVWNKIKYFNLYDAVTSLAVDEDLFAKGGYYEAVNEKDQVYVAKISQPDVIKKILYSRIVDVLN